MERRKGPTHPTISTQRSSEPTSGLNRNDVIDTDPAECAVEIREAPDGYVLEGVPRFVLCPPAVVVADALGEPAFFRAAITQHQEDIFLLGNVDEPGPERVVLAEHERVVVKKEHPRHVDPVAVGFELGQDHLPEHVVDGLTGGAEHVRDVHTGGRSGGVKILADGSERVVCGAIEEQSVMVRYVPRANGVSERAEEAPKGLTTAFDRAFVRAAEPPQQKVGCKVLNSAHRVIKRMQHVKVPQDRIGVLIGEGGETMREIERQAEVRLDIDSESGAVAIDEVGDPVSGMLAPDIVRAIGRGFTPESALSLLDGELRTFELVDLDAHTRNKNDLRRQKGRLIGEDGRTRELMEELTGAEVVIKGSTLGVIGQPEEVDAVRRAVGMILDGAPHGAVYSFLERKHNELTQGFDVRQSG